MLIGNYFKTLEQKYKFHFFSGISFNSLKIKKKDIFFAIRGNKINANKFIKDAIKKGAKTIVSNLSFQGKKNGILYIKSSNSRKECIIDSFTMLSPGREYTTEPTVYINGDPDVAESVIENGKVISVRIKNRSIVFDRYPKVIIIGGGGYGARFIPSFACLDQEARVEVGSAKIGTGKYIDCP